MTTTYSTVFGTLPNVGSLLGEDTLTISYPVVEAGATVVLCVIGTTAGSTSPTANGLFTGATWDTSFTGTVRFYYTEPETAVGSETGSVTITKGSALSRLVGAVMLVFPAAMTYDSWSLQAHEIVTNHNSNAASGGTPLASTLLDDGTNDGMPIPDPADTHHAYTVWYWGEAGNSGHPVTGTFAGPDTETLLVSATKDEEANPNNANTRDRYIRVSEADVTGTIADVVDTFTDTSGFANPNQSLVSLMAFRFMFINVPVAANQPTATLELPQTLLNLKVLPNRLNDASLDGFV